VSCKHLTELYEMCLRNNVKLSSTDLIRMVCTQCGVEEECPSLLCRDYDALHERDGEPQQN
jgi:hypothetical protein